MTASKGIYFRPPRRLSLAERLDFYSIPEPNSGCLLWLGTVNQNGQARMSWNGKEQLAYRLVWELSRGPIPDGLCVCHKCDVPACINLDHLFLGTHADNMADAAVKKRMRSGGVRGSAQGSAKLTEATALAIFLATGTQRSIARRFGVGQKAVWTIKNRLGWRHIHAT